MFLSAYDFFNPYGSEDAITRIATTWQYWLPVIISLVSLSFLFIFKKFYLRMAKQRWFLVSLGIFQLTLYFVYYFLHFFYLYYFKENYNASDPRIRGWTWIAPLHLSSITQLLSGLLLIKPNNKVFSLTAPWVVIMVFASLLFPADKYYGPQHFSYWIYYVIHIIIIFTYWFLYMYGIVKFDRKYLLWSFLLLILFSLTALGYNALSLVMGRISNEFTNLLYLGRNGYPLPGGLTTANIFARSGNLWPLGFIFLFLFGIIFASLGFLVLSKIQPYYIKQANKFAPLPRKKQTWDFKTLLNLFTFDNFKAIIK